MRLLHAVTILISLICSHYSLSIPRFTDQNVAESQSVLDPKGDLLLKWKVDYVARRITFQLQLSENAAPFKWLALGFSDRGDLENSDVCLLWTDYKGTKHFEDMNGDEKGKLHRDAHQDCEHFAVDAATRSIVFERYFDTCDDDNDYIIEDGTTHIIWARGTDKLFSSNGLCLPCTSDQDHGFIRVRLLTPPSQPPTQAKEIRFTNKELRVPGGDTTYWCKVFRMPEFLVKKMHHIVQFQSTITRGNEGLVHHMELFYCDSGPDVVMPLYEGDCFSPDRPSLTKTCSKVKAAWAMGAPPFIYPGRAGLPLGGPRAGRHLMLEVHYNNPARRADWIDSSGISIRVTSSLRKFDAAIMELGLEYTDKMAIPGGQRAFPLTGHCVPECTGVGLPPQGIVVFGSQLHTHLTGAAVWTRLARRGAERAVLNKDMHYSTHFQEIRILHRPVRVLPGDYLQTTCLYQTLDKVNATVGGHAITDEMCVNYLHYYPATQLEVCKSAISNAALESYFNFEKNWDSVSLSRAAPPRGRYLSVRRWSPLRARALAALYAAAPLSVQCNKSDGHRFQGEWEGIPIPRIRVPLPAEPRHCPNTRHGY